MIMISMENGYFYLVCFGSCPKNRKSENERVGGDGDRRLEDALNGKGSRKLEESLKRDAERNEEGTVRLRRDM